MRVHRADDDATTPERDTASHRRKTFLNENAPAVTSSRQDTVTALHGGAVLSTPSALHTPTRDALNGDYAEPNEGGRETVRP